VNTFNTHKTRMIGLPCGGEVVTMLGRFHLIPKRHGRTDGPIDRHTELLSISRVSRLTRDKNSQATTKCDVGQIKRGQLTFLLVISERIY